MISQISELKTFTKHLSCECKYKFDGRKLETQIKSRIMINVCVSTKFFKKKKILCLIILCVKIIFGILQHVVVKIVNL